MKKTLCLTLALATAVQAAEQHPATLYQGVSPDAYLRLPQQWTLLLADGARDPSAMQTHWQTVQNKLAPLPASDNTLSAEEKTILNDIFAHNNAPLEIAFYFNNGGKMQALLASRFDYQDDARFLEFVQSIAKTQNAEHQGDGKSGRLTGIGETEELQAAYQYNQNSGEHRWLIGLQLPEKIDWDNITAQPQDSLLAASAQIDPEGHGLLLWARNNPIMLKALTDEHSQWVKALQLLKLKSLSGGYGIAADGKPKLQLNAEITPGGLRDLFPAQQPSADLAIHGELQTAYAITLPDSAATQKILRIIEQGQGTQNLYADLKKTLADETRLDLDILLNAIGTQWHIINDDLGQIYAIRKSEHWQQALDMLHKAGYLTLEPVGDSDITHARLNLAPLYTQSPEWDDVGKHPLLKALLNTPQHLYYQEEGNHIVIAELPQPLQDRARTKGGSNSGTYLGSNAQQDTTLLAIGKIDHLARRHYYSRLTWLQYLADVGGADINIAALPSAQMLDLPENGYLQAALGSDAQNLRLQLTFENSLLDPFQHTGFYNSAAGIATLGILSAIAIPAYQDYVERVEAAESQAQAEQKLAEMSEDDIAAIQTLIDTIYTESEALRNAAAQDNSEAARAASATLSANIAEISDIDIENGIYINFGEQAPEYLQQSQLILWPGESDETPWYCYLDDPYLLGDALLPASCSPYNE